MNDVLDPTNKIFVNFMENPEIVAFDKDFFSKNIESLEEELQF